MATKITGFDIGEKTLKMACFSGHELINTVTADVPENMVDAGQIVSADAMSDFIAQLAKDNKISKQNAALILPPSVVSVRNVQVPVMSDSQLKFNLPYEFKDYLTQDKSKYYFDYEVVDVIKDENGEPSELKLFACAAPKDVVERFRVIFERAGFKLKMAAPEEYIYAKLCRGNLSDKIKSSEHSAIVDIGYNETRMHILSKGQYDNKRTFDVGIEQLEQLVADITYSDVHMAHNYILSNYEDVLSSERCKEFYNHLAVEILKAVNFYNYNNQEAELDDVYMIGGGSAIKPLADMIRMVSGVEVHDASQILSAELASEEKPWNTLRAISCAYGE